MARLTQTFLSLLRSGWLLVGVILAFLLVLEGTAAVSMRAFARSAESRPPGEGVPGVYKAKGATHQRWEPFVYWRTATLSSPHVNVDANGLRRTWSASAAGAEALRIFMFGASTLRGHGARDEFTIPSITAKILTTEFGLDVVVTNCGQKGYVGTQDLIALLLELRQGNVPDAVVFYDGIMDVQSAYHAQVAGIPHHEWLRRMAFEDFESAALVRLARRSSLVELALRYVDGWDWSIPGVWHPPDPPDGFAPLAEEVVRIYVANLRIAQALADGYGFDILHYWQPILWSKSAHTPFEKWVLQDTLREYPLMDRLFAEVYTRVSALPELSTNPRFANLERVMDEADEPVFWDAIHTTEAGNALIANRIANDLREVLQQP